MLCRSDDEEQERNRVCKALANAAAFTKALELRIHELLVHRAARD